MPPVARAKPLQPSSEREQRLLEAVEGRYPSYAAFYRTVAEKLGTTIPAEKSAFNRIIRGRIGNQTAFRIRAYADLLDAKAEEFLRPAELRGDQRDGSLWKDPDLVELEDKVVALTRRVDRLSRQVSRLGPPGDPRTRAEKKA